MIEIGCFIYSQLWKGKRLEEEELNKEMVDDVNPVRSDSLP